MERNMQIGAGWLEPRALCCDMNRGPPRNKPEFGAVTAPEKQRAGVDLTRS